MENCSFDSSCDIDLRLFIYAKKLAHCEVRFMDASLGVVWFASGLWQLESVTSFLLD